MDPKIKLIAFDLDGTLLNSEKVVSDRTKDALLAAAGKGVYLVPTTGRPIGSIPKDLLELPGVRYVITANGARILDMAERKTLKKELLSREKCDQILAVFEKYDTLREVYFDGIGYAEREKLARIHIYQKDPAMQRYVCATRRPVDSVREKFETETMGMDKIQALFANLDDKEAAWREVERLIPDVEVTGALSDNVEVTAKGIHKGNAILELAELLELQREEVMAFGDGKNDVQMLAAAGTGVAMGNSVPEVLEVADIVTDSNDEDGVAKMIEKYVLK